MERAGVFDWKCFCICAVLCCRRRGERCNQGPDRDRDLVLHCAAVLSPALHPWLRSGCQDHRAHQDPAVWEGKASHACWCIVSCYRTLCTVKYCSMGRERKSRLLVYRCMLPDTVPWSTAVWEGKESHVYWCIVSCYRTLCTVKYCSMERERKSRLLVYRCMLPDTLYCKVLQYGKGKKVTFTGV